MSALNQPQFKTPEAARSYLEALRWPNGAVCPHCGVIGDHYALQGKATRPGVWKCHACREQFSVTVGTVFEKSKIKLNVWLQAVFLLCSSKKGMSSHQLHRILGVTYKTAWFMTHRIREAMKSDGGMLGGGGKIVEVDETYFGNKEGSKARIRKLKRQGKHRGGAAMKEKNAIVALVEREGQVRAMHVPSVTQENLSAALFRNMATDSHLMTDESTRYWNLGKAFDQHSSVNHARKEYARGNVTTNTVEGFFSVLKRGLIGTYHHVGENHLQRYVEEFSFRYNNRTALGVTDAERANKALRQIGGKRLTYRRINEAA
ncbi:MAG TPA: IS1595 family transposase [Burkholderiales bacterium]|nr:IS1595 family transposase [Burkholderiales bacterium]